MEKSVHVPDMGCGHCVATIERELGALPGVRRVVALLDGKRVEVEWDEAATDWGTVRSKLAEIGYPPAE